jgi:hypothetical protein
MNTISPVFIIGKNVALLLLELTLVKMGGRGTSRCEVLRYYSGYSGIFRYRSLLNHVIPTNKIGDIEKILYYKRKVRW